MADPSLFSTTTDGIRIAVRLTPKARHNRITGPQSEADGSLVLAVAVTAPPEDGKANAALIKLLAKEWRIAKTRISVVNGLTSRRKTLHIDGDPKTLLAQLDVWMETFDG